MARQKRKARVSVAILISLFLLVSCTKEIKEIPPLQEIPPIQEISPAEPAATPAEEIPNESLPQEDDKDAYSQKMGEGNLAGLSSCKDKKVLFNKFPVNLDNFPVITPLGYVGATAHLTPTPHLFLRPKRAGSDESYTLESSVLVPTNMRIYLITSVEDISTEKKFATDYGIYFSPCTEVVGYFDHVWDLPPKIQEALSSAPRDLCHEYTLIYDRPVDWRFCRQKVSIDVKEGEYLGKTGGKGKVDVFDFALMDYRLPPHPYTNIEQWRMMGNTFEEAFQVTCPLNYFPDTIRLQAESRLGAEDTKRTIAPVCGEVFQDRPGTAQGVWFTVLSRGGDENQPGARHLSLVHDAVNPQKPVFVVGEGLPSIGYGDYFFTIKENGRVNRDFRKVIPGQIYCFDSLIDKYNQKIEGRILLQLPEERKLLLEKQAGACQGSWELSGKESRFER